MKAHGRESGGGKERSGDSSLSGCADGDRGRTDGRDGGIKRCNHSIVLIERPTGRKRERAREDSMAIRLKKAAQKIALGQKLASKPAGNKKCEGVDS